MERTYEAVDDPADVRRDAIGDVVRQGGARSPVKLTLVAPSRRYHVALVDPLPAGFEALNPALAVTGNLPAIPGHQPRALLAGGGGVRGIEHQNLRDERAEAFTSLLWDGVYTYTYIAARDDARPVLRPAGKGGGNVRPGDLRARGRRFE